jgi:colanic acid/amylovoran biosynthesis protein
MKVMVVNAYVRENAGDAALLSVLLDQLESAFPGCDICVSSMEDPRVRNDFYGHTNIGSIRRYTGDEQLPRLCRIGRKVLIAAVGPTWFRSARAAWRRCARFLPSEARAEVQAVESSDLIVSLGGGYLSGTKSLGSRLHLSYSLLPVVLGQRLGKPVVFAPQSFGPWGSARQARRVGRCLSRARLVLAREDGSLDVLKEMGTKSSVMGRAVDSAFSFGAPAQNWRQRLALDVDEVLVGITARKWLDPERQSRYERALASVIDQIQAAPGQRAILIPQVMSAYQSDDDRIVNTRIAAYCRADRQPLLLAGWSSHYELKALYKELDCLIGTRLHSVIFSLTSYVPSIAIGYEHKTLGVMHDLGLERWFLRIEDVTEARLTDLVQRLMHSRASYLLHLKEVLPPYMERANEVSALIKQAYGRHQSLLGSDAT